MGLILLRALPCILILLVLNAGCAPLLYPPLPEAMQAMEKATPGTVFSAHGHQIPLSDLAALVPVHDFILIGESHANTCDHQFQKDALVGLAASQQGLALGLEMVPWSAQDVLDAFNHREIPLAELENELDWPDYWGFSFAMYSPILAQARALEIPVFGLNVPKDLLQRIRTDGLASIPADQRGLLPPVVIPAPPKQRELLEEEFSRHMEMMPGRTEVAGFELERFVLIQSLWDTQMAFSAAHWQRETGRTMVILTGSGHVEYGYGIPHRLRTLEGSPQILTLLPWRDDHEPDPTAGDLFFYCPERPQRLGVIITWVDDQAVLSNVLPGSLADTAGLQPGDVLRAANDKAITSLEVLHQAAMQAVGTDRLLRLDVLRNGADVQLNLYFP